MPDLSQEVKQALGMTGDALKRAKTVVQGTQFEEALTQTQQQIETALQKAKSLDTQTVGNNLDIQKMQEEAAEALQKSLEALRQASAVLDTAMTQLSDKKPELEPLKNWVDKAVIELGRKNVQIISDNQTLTDVIERYKTFSDRGDGFEQPKLDPAQGAALMTFPNAYSRKVFVEKMAKEGKSFIAKDPKTGQVIARSEKGKLTWETTKPLPASSPSPKVNLEIPASPKPSL